MLSLYMKSGGPGPLPLEARGPESGEWGLPVLICTGGERSLVES